MSERLMGSVISIHALLAESDVSQTVNCSFRLISIHALLAESDGFRPVNNAKVNISIHALLAESDGRGANRVALHWCISIHALLAESDAKNTSIAGRITSFLSTLSLRRATASNF